MHVTGKINEPQFTADGRLRIVLDINDANAYFWQLVDKISKVIKTDKWTVYLMQLSNYGIFTDVVIKSVALETLQAHFRYTQILKEQSIDEDTWLTVRCFYGSSDYNTKEMSDLISGTVDDAKALNIETLPEAEIERLLQAMKEKA